MDELKLYQICVSEDFSDHKYLRNYCLFAPSIENAKEDFQYIAERMSYWSGELNITNIKEVRPKSRVLLSGKMEPWSF